MTMSDRIIDKGIITYMYLENFVTYNKVDVKPGRNLNVIIGPNGTGKSTIVCAIVLGLGGKPSTIGRATHVAEYVKAGCVEATIEIHLTNGASKDIVIKRVFSIHGKSLWFIDGKSSNIKAIQQLTKSFDIQVDNLCQFLPQDKVQHFSSMNAQELLENTERSVGNTLILEYHHRLINHRSEMRDLEVEMANKKKLLESKNQIYEGLKETVSNVKERKLIKKKIVSLKQKKAWLTYELARKELMKVKKQNDLAAGKVKSLKAEIEPIINAIEQLKSQIAVLKNSVIDHNNKVSIKNSKLKKMIDGILECENNIIECKNTCTHRIETEEARDANIEIAQQQKSKLANDLSLILNDIGPEETLVTRKREMESRIEEQRNIVHTLTLKNSAIKQEEERITLDIRAQEAQLQLLDINAKRLQLLRRKSVDAYNAVHWLRDNQDKFSGKIHEPMLLSINVKNATYPKYLESIIAYRDLIAFVCENKQDMNLLLRYLRDERNLEVNAVYSDPSRHVSSQPIIPLENIRQFGFTDYLASLIEAPPTIMKYLVSMYNLNNIPVGSKRVDDNTDRIPQNLRYYFSENNFYAVHTSKYTGDKSTSIKSVFGSGILSIVLDKSKLLKVEETLKMLREKKSNALDRIKQIEEQICKEDKILVKYRADGNKFKQDLQQVQALQTRIAMAQKRIEDLQNKRTSIEQIKKSCASDIQAILKKQLKIYKTYNSELEDNFKCITENEKVKFALQLQNRSLLSKTNDSRDLRNKLEVAERELKAVNANLQEAQSEVKKIYNEALNTTNGISSTDAAFAAINKTFKNLPPTVDEINTELSIAQAKVFCMGNNIDGESILREYETVEKDIKNLNKFIETKTTELETMVKDIEFLRGEWIVLLSEIVEKINSNFGSYFSAMGCAGEVTLTNGPNIMDFDQYGLKIRVKFRDTDELQELTRQHQSGGERAVTTAIYMISLQELSRVPFRCVDEINQGMDAANERRIFNLLVNITARTNNSQYFLLTPKLLPGLEYSDTVRVHCVFNGSFMIGHNEFDMEQYCNAIKGMETESLDED